MESNAGGASASNDGPGPGAEARGCNNCAKRGPWQWHERSDKKARRYELAECSHIPKPAWWHNAGPVWVGRGCGIDCKVYKPKETDGHEEATRAS